MPLENIVVIGLVVLGFGVFMITLAWAQRTTEAPRKR